MSGTTTNYGWTYPTSTDYVKDGATAIQTVATGVDTTLGTALNNKIHAGLVLVKTQAIGTGVSSVTVTNAFSATYDNYKILIAGGTGGNADGSLNLTLGSINTGYYCQLIYAGYSSGVVQASGTSNGSSFIFAAVQNLYSINGDIEIQSPYLTEQKMIQAAFYDRNNTGRTTGLCDSLTSQTSFTLTTNAGTMTGGTIAVYGYAKD